MQNFTKFPGEELCFNWNFQGYREKQEKLPGFFQKSNLPSPVWVFSGITQSKTIDLNWSYEALVQKEALTVYQDRTFASFPCVLSLSSVLGRFKHLYCDAGSLGRGALSHVKIPPPPLPYQKQPTILTSDGNQDDASDMIATVF